MAWLQIPDLTYGFYSYRRTADSFMDKTLTAQASTTSAPPLMILIIEWQQHIPAKEM